MKVNASSNMPLLIDRLLCRISELENATVQTPIPGETMEKTKTKPCLDNKSSQIILFVMENISLSGTPGAIPKTGKTSRNGM
jgi:hypothetical protein